MASPATNVRIAYASTADDPETAVIAKANLDQGLVAAVQAVLPVRDPAFTIVAVPSDPALVVEVGAAPSLSPGLMKMSSRIVT